MEPGEKWWKSVVSMIWSRIPHLKWIPHLKDNIGRISKIVNFHPIDLKFEEKLQIWSLNSTSQLFLRSNLFYGFCKYRVLHHIFFFLFCLSVRLSPTGHNFKLHKTSPHGRVCHKEEAYFFFWGQKVNIGQRSTT